MYEVIFLVVLGLIWIVYASVQDVKTREVSNWLNFSLVIFALGFRFFYSLFSGNGFGFFYYGLIGFGIFFILANIFYYSRIFAGGDAKLLMSMGAIFPVFQNIYANLYIMGIFIFIFFVCGSVYTLGATLFIISRDVKRFKKEFLVYLSEYKKYIYVVMVLGLLLMALGIGFRVLFYLGLLIFILPFLYVYVKSADRLNIQLMGTSKLSEGDWLYKDVKVGTKVVKASWDGLTKQDLKTLKSYKKKVEVRRGVEFVPNFLISYIVFWTLFYTGLII